MSKLEFLVGQRITGIFVREDDGAIAFRTQRGTFAVDTYADCCSETWFADILGVGSLIGQPVSRVEEYALEGDPKDGRSRQEHDEVMGVRLITYRGVCDVIFRNSSNGYYGGSLGNVFVPESLHGWKPVTDDWTA